MELLCDVEVTVCNKRVVWEYIGEGWSGEFDESIENDEPLLRFSCLVRSDDGWEPIDDASYCTRMPVTSPLKHLLIAAAEILEALEQPSPKRRLEELSWLCPEDFDPKRVTP